MLFFLLACPPTPKDSPTPESPADSPEDSPVDSTLDPDTVRLDGPCPLQNRYGNFTVDANADYAYVSGQVLNGVVPLTILTKVAEEGECTLWRKENPFCDPTCEPGETCSLEGVCVPYPTGQELGTVTVAGLLEPVSMEPVIPGYTYFNTSVPNPPWTPGEVAVLQSHGYAEATLYGVAPEKLTPQTASWTLEKEKALSILWDAPSSPSRALLHITIQVDQHGSTPGSMECWFEDDGAGEVPVNLVNTFLEMGLSGFPNGLMERASMDSTEFTADACMDFKLGSSLLPDVAVSGYTPCNSDPECPRGYHCNEELQRCEED
jgi:hypothetical protein